MSEDLLVPLGFPNEKLIPLIYTCEPKPGVTVMVLTPEGNRPYYRVLDTTGCTNNNIRMGEMFSGNESHEAENLVQVSSLIHLIAQKYK